MNSGGLTFKHLDNGNLQLTKNYGVSIGHGQAEWWIAVPAGFKTDGASIPRLLWPIVGPPLRANYLRAAVVHDFLCVEAYRQKSYTLRAIADAVFLHLLADCGVGKIRRGCMYAAVRWWGRFTYRRDC